MTLRVAVRRAGDGVRQRQADFAAVPAIVIACLIVGPARCGFDSTWALVWGGDLLHGHAAEAPAGVVLPTVHPASLLVAVVIRAVGGAAAAPQLWAWLTDALLLAALAGVYALGLRLAGRAAAVVSVITFGCCPALQAAVGMGTVDVLFAAASVWALCLCLTRPAAAIGLGTVAALARPEGWLVLLLLVALTLRGPNRRQSKAFGLAALVAVPGMWLLCGELLFADPLSALHVTVGNAKALADVTGLSVSLRTSVSAAGVGCAALLAGLAGWVCSRDRLSRQLQIVAAAGCGMTVLLVALGAAGITTPTRYFTAELAILLPVAFAAVWQGAAASSPVRASLAVAAACWVVAALTLHVAHPGDRDHFARQQGHAALALDIAEHAGSCQSVSIPPSVFVGAALLESPKRVTVASTGRQQCRLVPLTDSALTGLGWGPEPTDMSLPISYAAEHLIARNADWGLDVVG